MTVFDNTTRCTFAREVWCRRCREWHWVKCLVADQRFLHTAWCQKRNAHVVTMRSERSDGWVPV